MCHNYIQKDKGATQRSCKKESNLHGHYQWTDKVKGESKNCIKGVGEPTQQPALEANKTNPVWNKGDSVDFYIKKTR